jgi:peroxiredoxin Q/BCP
MPVINGYLTKKFCKAMKVSVGDPAPDFSIKDQDGKDVSLSDFKGRKVVLYFYPKDMTPGCTAEACSLRDNYHHLLRAGYEVLGISSDDEKSHRKFIEKEKLPFRLLADTDKAVHHKYGTWVEKSMYGRKYMGTARVTFIINEDGLIEEIIEKVDTKNHADQILKSPVPGTLPKAKLSAGKVIKRTSAKKSVKKTPTRNKSRKKK